MNERLLRVAKFKLVMSMFLRVRLGSVRFGFVSHFLLVFDHSQYFI